MQTILFEVVRDFARQDQPVKPMITRMVKIASNNTREVI